MTILSKLHGIVHGRTIELADAPGLPDGQPVTVELVVNSPLPPSAVSDVPAGLLAACGALADLGEEVDEFNAWYRQARQADRPPLEPTE
jgi:hypothetical protein